MRTYFQDFKRDNGAPITVEYSFSAGSETTYSPRYGADGGEPCEVMILKAWPKTELFERLCQISNAYWGLPGLWNAFVRFIVRVPVRWLEWRSFPGDAELERMQSWIIENVTIDDDDSFEGEFG